MTALAAPGLRGRDDAILRAERVIAAIDEAVSRQVDAVLHAPAFQALEASWRGLLLLLGVVAQTRQVRLQLLDASWSEVARDLDGATEFDQSTMFRLIYSEGDRHARRPSLRPARCRLRRGAPALCQQPDR